MDLIIFYSPDKCTMTYYINNEQAGYKIEYPFSYIKNIWLQSGDDQNKLGGIVIELNHPPNFFMDSSPSTGFIQVGDFTEDMQATHCMVHHLGGNPKVLTNQLAKLVSLESFINRHNPNPYAADHAALPASAPVSPTARPSSQPNFAQQPAAAMQEPWAVGQMHSGMRPPHGHHKRQRSRSVPGPVDFAMFQNHPMPSFYIQPPGEMAPPPHATPLYAPVPQPPPQPPPGEMPNGLRIDTQAGFGLEMRQYPMSATTASPSEFPPSPGYFPQGPDAAAVHGSGSLGTPYGGAFLSPMVAAEANVPSAVSPLPFNGSAEPSIVEQSPPMSLMGGRTGSADMYAAHEASSYAVSEDGTGLNEMYSKHSNLPMHTPSPGAFAQPPHGELDMDQLVQFDAVDASSLSPETKPPLA